MVPTSCKALFFAPFLLLGNREGPLMSSGLRKGTCVTPCKTCFLCCCFLYNSRAATRRLAFGVPRPFASFVHSLRVRAPCFARGLNFVGHWSVVLGTVVRTRDRFQVVARLSLSCCQSLSLRNWAVCFAQFPFVHSLFRARAVFLLLVCRS